MRKTLTTFALVFAAACGSDALRENSTHTVDQRSDKSSSNSTPNSETGMNDSGGTSTGTSSTGISAGFPSVVNGVINGGIGSATASPGVNPSSSPVPAASATPTPVTAQTCYQAPTTFICQVELAITDMCNQLRSASSQLTYQPHLAFVARQWSLQQQQAGALSQTGFPGARQSAYVTQFGSLEGVQMLAENVAYGFSSSTQATDIAAMLMDLWTSDPSHLQNIQGPYTIVGVGVSQQGQVYYATQIFGTSN